MVFNGDHNQSPQYNSGPKIKYSTHQDLCNCTCRTCFWCPSMHSQGSCLLMTGTVCTTKPTDNWTTDVYVDLMVLSGEGVPRQAMHVQGLTLSDLLESKKRHHRQLQLQTKLLEKQLQLRTKKNADDLARAGIGVFAKPLPSIRTNKSVGFGCRKSCNNACMHAALTLMSTIGR